jgi:hypothetical protein
MIHSVEWNCDECALLSQAENGVAERERSSSFARVSLVKVDVEVIFPGDT